MTEQAKHTPGPIEVRDNHPNHSCVYLCAPDEIDGLEMATLYGGSKDHAQVLADARRLEHCWNNYDETAAELAKVRELCGDLAGALEELIEDPDGRWPDSGYHERDSHAKARAAIAKAKGVGA